MNFLVTTPWLPVGKRQVHLWKMETALRAIGVEPKLTVKNSRYQKSFFNHGNRNDSLLWDYFEEAKRLWLAGCKLIRTDLIEHHESAAVWNALWTRIKELFLRKGIGVNF